MRKTHQTQPHTETLEGRALLSVAFVERGANNFMRNAQVVSLDPADGNATVFGRISRGDQDVFRLDPAVGGTLQLSLNAAGRNAVELDVFTNGSQLVLQETARNGHSTGVVSVTAGQDVFVRIRGMGRGTAAYQILYDGPSATVTPVVTTPIATTPIPMPNPSPVGGGGGSTGSTSKDPTPSQDMGPTMITLDASGNAQVSGTIDSNGDPDVYAITAPKTGRMTFSIRRTGSTPLTLTVTDSTGKKRLNIDSDIPSFIAFIQAQQGETYTITIAPRGAGPAPYMMTVSEK